VVVDPQHAEFRAAQIDLRIRGAAIIIGTVAAVAVAMPLFVGVSYIGWLWHGYALWFPLPLPLCWLLGRLLVAVRRRRRARIAWIPVARVLRRT
jgi:hypothetical protein